VTAHPFGGQAWAGQFVHALNSYVTAIFTTVIMIPATITARLSYANLGRDEQPIVCHFRQNRVYRRGKMPRSFATS
jgi:hypothetical protein